MAREPISSPTVHPLANAESVAEIHAHRWPSCDEFDYTAITQAVERDDGFRPIHAGCYEPFLLYGYLRGLQTSLEDLALRPELADAILGHIFDFYHEHHRRIFEAGGGRIDLTYVAEDLGSQTGPLMSLAMYRRFLLPNQIKMAELARSFGVHVMYHTDGAARAFLPDLVDRVGIEVLNPIQWRCPGMERERLVADFGDRIIFHGSIDNQQTLPFGTVDDVIARGPPQRRYLPPRPLDLRPLPQPPAGQPHGEHRSDVRGDSRVGRAICSLVVLHLRTAHFRSSANGCPAVTMGGAAARSTATPT